MMEIESESAYMMAVTSDIGKGFWQIFTENIAGWIHINTERLRAKGEGI